MFRNVATGAWNVKATKKIADQIILLLISFVVNLFLKPQAHIDCISPLKSMKRKQYSQEAEAKVWFYRKPVWAVIAAGHRGQNLKSLIFTPSYSFQTSFWWKCSANDQEAFVPINGFDLAWLSCYQCNDSVITLNRLFLETHRLSGWWCKAASRKSLWRRFTEAISKSFSP